MDTNLPVRAAPTIFPTADVGSETSVTAGSGSSADCEWFFTVATGVLGKDAGLHLHYLTEYPERSCYAYVARDPVKRRKPPVHFLHKLFQHEQGEPFFVAFMQHVGSSWWVDRERARKVGAAALQAARD